MKISIIATVKNEAQSLPRLLDTIAAQTRVPDEIIIVDGGSTDGTLDRLREAATRLPIRVISEPGANISRGRNTAIRAACGDIICSTDAGVRLEPNWVEELVEPFDLDASTDVVSGFFIPDPHGVFETALAATTLPVLSDIRPESFLPSSRSVAFRKSAWEKVKGYPEWLDYCEDLIFDFDLRDAKMKFAFAPNAVAHFRPRSTLRAFFRQYYFYARGDGKANLWFKRHVIRYATFFVAFPFVIVLTVLAPFVSILFWFVAFFGLVGTPYKRLAAMLRGFSLGDALAAIAWVPVIRITGDVAKMMGYPVGIAWRLQNKPGRSK